MGLVGGFFDARNLSEPTWWRLFSSFLVSVSIFCWYRADSIQKEFKRTFWLNVGVVAVAPLAIPLYVFSSNEKGLRLRALGRVLGYSVLLFLMGVVGGVIGSVIS
ncbi:hypothetical protein [Duganella sp. S19_KUP01_CR8]|uniref:hypothetical protein n=1 Tax=Duganella sp. S19_KUP01_CR8 TaxID=3025502 RepID=UPI002FCD7646